MEYRRPRAAERDAIVQFLAKHWRADHVFVQDPAWLDWQHLDSAGDAYHAIGAFDAEGALRGFLGVMPLSLEPGMLATGIWVVDPACPDRSAGLSLFRALDQIYPAHYVGSLGVNAKASAVLRLLGHRAGVAETFVLAGAAAAHPVLSSGLAPRPEKAEPSSVELVELATLDGIADMTTPHLPSKPMSWYRWRYETGAPYRYRFFRIGHELIVVARVVAASSASGESGVPGASCLRIVDVAGNLETAGAFAAAFGRLIDREGHEYVELVVGGADLTVFERAGFSRKPADAIVPAYFDPFLARNAELGWTIRTAKAEAMRPAYIFRGDGDQDRPNRDGAAAPDYKSRPF